MADNADKGPDTLRPAKGDDAADLYSSSTVVRDAPSELVELMKQVQEGKVPKAPGVPSEISTRPPPPRPATKSEAPKEAGSASKSSEPSATDAKPAPKAEGPGRRLDELWDALPSASGDDDDDDDPGEQGSARLHAAEDVTRMLAVPDDLNIDGKRELTADEIRRIAEAQPSIVVEDGVASEIVSSRPRPPPKVESEDEILDTSPRKRLPALNQNRSLWIACAVAGFVLVAVAMFLAR